VAQIQSHRRRIFNASGKTGKRKLSAIRSVLAKVEERNASGQILPTRLGTGLHTGESLMSPDSRMGGWTPRLNRPFIAISTRVWGGMRLGTEKLYASRKNSIRWLASGSLVEGPATSMARRSSVTPCR
jgi:hypothetical protein